MKVMIDANVVLDVLLKAIPHKEVVGRRMNFTSDVLANLAGLPA